MSQLALLVVGGALVLGGCKSRKTPDLVRRWQVAGIELRSPTWRAINRDGDDAHGILRLRPPGAGAGLAGMSLRWDVVEPPADPKRIAEGLTMARELIVGHLVGELRVPGMVHPDTGIARTIQGHPGHQWEIRVDEAKVSATAVAWHCPVTHRSFIFDLQVEGSQELRQLLADRVLDTVLCHARATAVEAPVPPPIALAEGFVPLPGAPAGWARYRGGNESTLAVGPGVAMGERRGLEPEVAKRVVPWSVYPAVLALSVATATDGEGPRNHPSVIARGVSHDPSRSPSAEAGSAPIPTLAVRWDCPYRRKSFSAVATAPRAADLDALLPMLRQIRCHTDEMMLPPGPPPGDPSAVPRR